MNLPIILLLHLYKQLRHTLGKSVFSRKFYAEINDKILSKTSTLDANLYFICYFTLLLSSVLNSKHKILAFLVSQKRAFLYLMERYYLKLFLKPLTQAKPEIQSESLQEKGPDAKKDDQLTEKDVDDTAVPCQFAVHLKAISSYIADIRIFHRLTEAIKYMPWIIDVWAALMSSNLVVPRLDRFINFAQAINCLILELFENAGWLTDHNWVGTSDNNHWCIETYIWCSRVWGAYLVIEVLELLRRTARSKRNKDWAITFFTNIVQLPLVVHWSLYDGCLTPFWIGLCGSGASWFGFHKTWKSLEL